MAHGTDVPDTAIQSPTDVHKDSGLAVGNTRWYIGECKATRERTLRTMLQNAGYEAYVASQSEIHTYKSRNRRKVEKLLLPCRVFVHTEIDKLMGILLEYSSLYRFQLNKAGTPDRYGRKPFAFVPEDQMRQLQYVLEQSSNPVFFTADDLHLNQKVRIVSGPLTGLEGWFHQKGSASYIFIKVEMGTTNYAYTEIPLEDVQPIV